MKRHSDCFIDVELNKLCNIIYKTILSQCFPVAHYNDALSFSSSEAEYFPKYFVFGVTHNQTLIMHISRISVAFDNNVIFHFTYHKCYTVNNHLDKAILELQFCTGY